jgi:hypothetical protein
MLRSRRTGRLLGTMPVVIVLAFVLTGCDTLRGGGWIQSASLSLGEKATFGFTARCKTRHENGLPTAVFYEGQFEYDDHGANPLVRIHGNVEPNEFFSLPGQTCQDAATEPDLPMSTFAGTYRTQPRVRPSVQGDFQVFVADGGEPGSINGDEICVSLSGGIIYMNCGIVQGGNVQVG